MPLDPGCQARRRRGGLAIEDLVDGRMIVATALNPRQHRPLQTFRVNHRFSRIETRQDGGLARRQVHRRAQHDAIS